jgi:hypothetical protein
MRLALSFVLCIVWLTLGVAPTSAALVFSSARISIRVSVSGDLTDTVTLSHREAAGPMGSEYGCAAQTSSLFGKPFLAVDYNLSRVLNLDFSHPGFYLSVKGYNRSQSRYTDPSLIGMSVVLNGRGYTGTRKLAPNFKIAVTVANGGRAGSFRATHLVGVDGAHGSVSVSGAWRCDSLQP